LAQYPGDVVGLATLLGHTSLDTTRIYSQPTVEQLSTRVEQLRQNAYGEERADFKNAVSIAEKRKDNPSRLVRLAAEMENGNTEERHEPIHPMNRQERLTGGNVGP
jgi:hypothetical protein